MKSITTLLSAFMAATPQRGNLRILFGLLGILTVIVVTFSVTFHLLMLREGQEHSWLTGFYWTIVAMSTLGFGDVTFQSDAGRMFSVFVVVTGTVFMLVLLPFTFIQFFYAPWLEARDAARAPRALSPTLSGHVLLTGFGPVDRALVQRLRQVRTPYAVIVPDLEEALDLHAQGVSVMLGDLDDPDTYKRARAEDAALVVATRTDPVNTTIAATVRERATTVQVVALAQSPASVDILELAGCQRVLQLGELLGRAMARRVFGRDGGSHVIGQIDQVLIGEAAVAGTPLVGRTLRESGIRERFNLNVAGIWKRGRFTLGRPDTVVTTDTVLLLAGSRAQLDAYDAAFKMTGTKMTSAVIIGGGRVGRAAARALAERDITFSIVEQVQGRSLDRGRTVVGDAADLDVLNEAGIRGADCVVVTTHDDPVNVYLTLYCRRLRPDMLILSRATLERNTSTLHRVGADFVFSSASMGASTIFNMLRRSHMVFLAEGLDVFTTPVPGRLAGRALGETKLREDTGCNVLAVRTGNHVTSDLDPTTSLPAGGELILIGDREAEDRFFQRYV